MSLNFAQQIESVASRIQRRRWATAACWAFAAVVAAMLALAALDWLLGVYRPAGRIVLTSLLIAALALIARWSRGAVRGKMTPLAVTLELERRRPEYRSLLSSGLEFNKQELDDPTAGSLELRRAVVLRASLATDAIDVEEAAPRTPLRRAVAAALAAAVMLAVPAAIAPQTFATGAARLLNPLSGVEWPRRHDLAFEDPPRRMPIGGDFQTTLRDRRGRLPESVEVEYRTRRDGRWQYQTQTYAADGEALTVRMPNVQQSFEFRARGGDHKSMSWQRVEAAPAPQVASLEVTAHPPGYTGLPSGTVAEPIRIIAGTTLQLRGATDRPIQSARLQAEGQPAINLSVGGDGRSFATAEPAWQPAKTAQWSFAFTTPQKMSAVADRALAIQVVPDRPPTVEIAEPTGELFVVPEAKIEVAIEARDDLAVRSVSIKASPEHAPADHALNIQLLGEPEEPAAKREASYELQLSELAPAPGSVWQVEVVAADYAGQVASSLRPLRLRVISRGEFLLRMDALMSRMRRTLERGLEDQRDARQYVQQWLESSVLPNSDAALTALSRQRQVAEAVARGPESALRLSNMLSTELQRNQWPDASLQDRVGRIQQVLEALAATQLATAESGLTEFARDVQRFEAAARQPLHEESRALIAAVQQEQQVALTALEALVRELSQWSEVQQHQRELAAIKADQAALQEQTETLGREALRDQDGDKQRQHDRRRTEVAAEQRALGSRLTSTLTRMRQSAAELAANKPAEAARLDAAVAQAEKSHLQSNIRAAAEHLGARRFGQSASSQQRVGEQLQQLLDRMVQSDDERPSSVDGSPRPTTQAAGNEDKAQRQRAAERRRQTALSKLQIERLDAVLTRLVATQQSIIEETARLDGLRDADGKLGGAEAIALQRLARQQGSVREQTSDQAVLTEQFPVFARLLRMAADTMQQTESRLAEGDTGDPTARLASRAHDELKRLANAVRLQREQQSAPPPKPPEPQKPAGDDAAPKDDPDRVQALQLAVIQLGLLRTLQADLKEQTAELERAHAAGEIPDGALREQSVRLATEQRELVELAELLLREASLPASQTDAPPEPNDPLRGKLEE